MSVASYPQPAVNKAMGAWKRGVFLNNAFLQKNQTLCCLES